MIHNHPQLPLAQSLASVSLGGTQQYGALAVTSLLGPDQPACDYVTLDHALASGSLTITEVSDSGSVPELLVINHGPVPVLIVDGEELVGAKQNRVINLTVLVAAMGKTTIPVSCVEAGRWRRDSARFASSPRTHFASGRAARMAQVSLSMSVAGERRSDQSAVWSAISDKAARMQAPSTTAAMAAIFEQHADAVDQYVARMGTSDGQRGAIFSVNGRAAGIELFDRAVVCRRLMPKLVRSYAIDAIEASGAARTDACTPGALLERVASAHCRAFPAVGEGTDVRMEAAALVGGALVVHHRVVHLAAFAAAP